MWLKDNEKPASHQSIVIFDWDDTILATTFLVQYQQILYDAVVPLPNNIRSKLEELDTVACNLVKASKKYGKVYIVTNAAEGWVQMSAEKFMPKTNQELDGITVISARSRYEKMYPRNYQKWKIEAFLETRADMEEHAITNLVALGDNNFEIEAAYILGAQFKNAFIKTVKFRQ